MSKKKSKKKKNAVNNSNIDKNQQISKESKDIKKEKNVKKKEKKYEEHIDFKKNKLNILSLISTILLIPFIFLLVRVDVLPLIFLLIVIFILLVITINGIIFVNNRRKPFRIVGIVILTIITIISSIGTYYLFSTDNFLSNSFSNEIKNTTTYYVVTSSKNNYTKRDIKGDIYYLESTIDIKYAVRELKSVYNFNEMSYGNASELYNNVSNQTINLMLVDKNSYDIMFELDENLKKSDFKILYKFDVVTATRIKNSNKDSFNIYLVGSDFTNTMLDLNMILSINTKTHKVLLTSVPRDYYIEVAGTNGRRDTLSYMGPYGINTSVKSLENLFDIDINYYIKINSESLVNLVDRLDGINYCSDDEYTTSHALVLDTYNDSQGRKLHVKKGCQHLNGIETLTVARERNAFAGRDRVRQKNCQKILLAIIDRLKSIDTVVSYNELLDSMSDLYDTTIPRNVFTKVIKDTISSGFKWNFSEQSVDGDDTHDKVHLTDYVDWVMYPRMDTVETAKNKIKEVIK